MYFIDKLLMVFSVLTLVDAARILCVYPFPYHSHEVVYYRFTEMLASQGHELVVLAPISSDKKIPNVTIIDVKTISYNLWDKLSSEYSKKQSTISVDPIAFWEMMHTIMNPIVEAQLNVPEMQAILKNKEEHFDLILIEGCIRSALIVNARFQVPVIIVSTFYGLADNFYTTGGAIDPVIFPDYNIEPTYNSSLWSKLGAVYTSLTLRMLEYEAEKTENAMIRKHFGAEAPTMAELRKNVQMMFLNVHHVWDSNRPVPPNILYLGALHLKKPKALNNDLKKYLDSSKNGVVFMSLGSKIKSSELPSKTVNIIVKVLASLPYDFIWKWESDKPPVTLHNVRFGKWFPQSDLLHHPKTKAFITHAGLQSTDEAIAARVPLIGLPVKADQPLNAGKYEQHGIGIRLNLDNLDEEEFKEAILTVINNPNYRENIKKLARVMELERVGALDKALRWVNHIATYGGHQLRPPLPDLSFVEYYMLDVIAAIGVLLLITLLLLALITRYLFQYLTQIVSILDGKNKNKIKFH